MTATPLRQKGTEEMTEGTPEGSRHRGRGTPLQTGLACVVRVWFPGLPALPHSTSLPRRRGSLGRSPGDSARTRLQWHNAGKGVAAPDC